MSAQFFNVVWRRAIDAVFPAACPVTGERLADPAALGPQAWSRVSFIAEPWCQSCGTPFSVDYGAGALCPACIAEPPDFDRARAAVLYDEASHGLVVGFKHADRTEHAAMFGAWMARAGREILTPASLLAPVPLHPRRLMARRFNQSAMLAGAVARLTGAAYAPDLLRRRRATPPQKNLSGPARRRNVAGAFVVNEKRLARIRGADVVLVDDVLTTGATLSACARALKRAGAARVDALVLARVVKGGAGAI